MCTCALSQLYVLIWVHLILIDLEGYPWWWLEDDEEEDEDDEEDDGDDEEEDEDEEGEGKFDDLRATGHFSVI